MNRRENAGYVRQHGCGVSTVHGREKEEEEREEVKASGSLACVKWGGRNSVDKQAGQLLALMNQWGFFQISLTVYNLICIIHTTTIKLLFTILLSNE